MSDVAREAIESAVELFVHGAKTMLAGRFLDIQALYMKGLKIARGAVQTLDKTNPNGRDPLLPDHDDEMVRTIAGAALWQSATDRARAAIEDVDKHGITEASMLAWKILFFHGRYNPILSDPRYEGLYDGDHDERRGLDTALKARALRGELQATFALLNPTIKTP